MQDYARRQTANLLKKFTDRLHEAASEANSDAIHDVRVATRRLSRCLRIFGEFYPNGSWKKLRHQLSTLMHAAGAVRDCDVAIGLLQEAGIPEKAALVKHLKAQRSTNNEALLAEVRRWERKKLAHRWKDRLEV